MKARLKNMPIPVVATLLGAATLSNSYQSLGYSFIRHITMWAATLVLLFYLAKIILYPSVVRDEYKNTVPASLYAGLTMVAMILTSYYKTWFPNAARVVLIAAVCIHAVHILIFLCRNVFRGVKLDTFVPSWFVTFNGIMVSTVAGAAMLPPLMAKAVLIWGIFIYVATIPFMVWRLAKRELKPGVWHTQPIVLAPCSLCLVTYMNVIAHPNMVVMALFYLCVLASLIFIIIRLPSFFTVPFYPGFAGLTFPMAIGITASAKAAAFFTASGQTTLGMIIKQVEGIQIYLTTAIIGLVLFGFLKMLCFPNKTSEAKQS